MRLHPVSTAALLVFALGLNPGTAAARVDVSVQVTVAGAALGGVAWALSAVWSNRFTTALTDSLRPAGDFGSAQRGDLTPQGPIVYLPLIVLPLP